VHPAASRLRSATGVVGLVPGKTLTSASLRGHVAVDGKTSGSCGGRGGAPPQIGGSLKAALALGRHWSSRRPSSG